MMQDSTVAARYARALFIATEKRDETSRALGDVNGMASVLGSGTAVRGMLLSPGVTLAHKREALSSAFKGRVLPIVAVFVDLLVRKRRLMEFTGIAHEFEALVERREGIQRAELVSARPFDEAETRRLHAALEKYTHKKIRLSASVDAGVLGGAMVRIGDRLIDRTVRTLLERIGEQWSEASV
ncbi:MAG: ATP synthase F1 subunit delta [Candidatus Eiseniibacteriota bacterium]